MESTGLITRKIVGKIVDICRLSAKIFKLFAEICASVINRREGAFFKHFLGYSDVVFGGSEKIWDVFDAAFFNKAVIAVS